MKTVKKIISSFLVVCLVFTLLPATAFATGADDIVRIALGEVGVRGRPNKYTKECGPIGDMGYAYPWCAAFVSWCAKEAGESAAIPKTASVANMCSGIEKAGGKRVYDPKAGDIVIYRRKSDNYYAHVGIMENSSTSVEGNYDNAVKRGINPNNYHFSGSSVANGRIEVIYMRPNYKNVTPPTATLSIDRASTNYNPGDIVTFNFGGNNSGVYTLGIYKGSERIDTVTVYGNTYSRIFDEVAMYSAYMTAYNDYSYADSNWVGWQVNDLTANLSIDKTEIPQQGNITFTFGGNNVGTYANGDFTLGIYKDGVRTDTITVKGTTYTKAFSEPGSYKAYMTAFSGGGLADSNWVSWTVNPATRVIPEGDYVISPSGHSDYALDAAGGYSDAKTDIWLYQKNGTEAQTFSVVYVEGEWFKIVLKKNPQMCINVIGETRNGARLWLWPDDGTDSCYFRAIDCGDGTYKIQNKRGPDQRILDLSNDVAYNGAVVQLWDMHDTPAGRWRFTSVNIASGTALDAPPIVRRGYIQF